MCFLISLFLWLSLIICVGLWLSSYLSHRFLIETVLIVSTEHPATLISLYHLFSHLSALKVKLHSQ
ncbi:unnamed protein product, partial [Brassica oleracea]